MAPIPARIGARLPEFVTDEVVVTSSYEKQNGSAQPHLLHARKRVPF